MTPRNYFTLVLRGMGIWKIFDGLEQFVTVFNVSHGYYTPQMTDARAFTAHAILAVFGGVVLLFGAPTISAFVVPAVKAGAEPEQLSG